MILTENGFLFATLPATVAKPVPVVALLAHVDTVADIGGNQVKPRVHHAYDGSPITFPDDELLVLMPELNPYLAHKIGDDIITGSGGTILGADDKAGVAIIMARPATCWPTRKFLTASFASASRPTRRSARASATSI